MNCSSISKISLPSSVESIGNYAFAHCLSLSEILIPSSIKSIGIYAFFNCSSISKILLPSSVESIGDYTFCRCSSLLEVSVPSSVKLIGSHAFAECSSITQISIPSSVKSIGDCAFENCSSLSEMCIPSSVESIGDSAFAGCSSITQISIPSSVKSIGNNTFFNCESLSEICIPSSVKLIGRYAFDGCSSITRISIPSSVKSIEDYAFYRCHSLSEVSVPSSVRSLGDHIFDECCHLEDLVTSSFHDYDDYDEEFVYKWFYLIFLPVSLLGMFIDFIISLVWWLRIHPWFAHGYKTGKIIYQSLEVCWISFLIEFIYISIYILFNTIMKKCYKRFVIIYRKKAICDKLSHKMKYVFIVTIILSISLYFISMISGIIASCYALKNEKIEGKSIKCLKYILDGYQGANEWATHQSSETQKNLEKWHLKMLKKAYGKNDKITNYYCLEVGIPILLFSIIPLIELIIFTSIGANMFFGFRKVCNNYYGSYQIYIPY
ncbi:hypothetical protein M9Y10_039247 [Tritrichomonas musculus]|uniref:Surface antigen BspA-like n=1 Tax=Tritrichomonas musculus TaxID=1915356 RepID=A0ABR2KBF5_9EUKA